MLDLHLILYKFLSGKLDFQYTIKFNSAEICLEKIIEFSKDGYFCRIEDHSYYEKTNI